MFVGIAVFVYLAAFHDMNQITTWQLMVSTVLPIPLINLLVARARKALFIALDHFVDPHVHTSTTATDGDDDDGTRLIPTPPAGGSAESIPATAGAGFRGRRARKTRQACTAGGALMK